METLRLSLHILGACIWVGGQIVLGALVPTLRKLGPDAPKNAANAFNKVAWGGFGLLVVTGLWNMMVDSELDQMLFGVKFLFVLISAGGAALHIVGGSKQSLAIGGALASLGAIGSLVLGVALSVGS